VASPRMYGCEFRDASMGVQGCRRALFGLQTQGDGCEADAARRSPRAAPLTAARRRPACVIVIKFNSFVVLHGGTSCHVGGCLRAGGNAASTKASIYLGFTVPRLETVEHDPKRHDARA